MRVMVSGAAGCAAYVEGENLHFIHLASHEGWKTTARRMTQHVFLQASDITEIEVSSREEAEAHARLKTDVTHALQLMELVIATKLPEVASLSASYLEGWLGNRAVRSEIEKYCFATSFPEDIDANALLARPAPPLTRALLQEIVTAQPRIRMVNELLERYIPRVATRPEEQIALKSAFVDSGAIQAMVRDHAVRPNDLLTGQYSGLRPLFQQIDNELRAKNSSEISLVKEQIFLSNDRSGVWQVAIGLMAIILATPSIFMSISVLRFDDIKMIVSAIALVALVFGALAIINRNK